MNNCKLNDTSTNSNAVSSQQTIKTTKSSILNRTTFIPLNIPSAQIISAEWISIKMKNELNLDESKGESTSTTQLPFKIKEEKLDESEMTDEQKKRKYIKSMQNAFEVRTIDVNQIRQMNNYETDSFYRNTNDTSFNKSKNFKTFVKVIFYSIPNQNLFYQ